MASTLDKRLAPLTGLPADRVLVSEIFTSIQGESTHAGRLCTFVRTAACNLRCGYCDTTYAFMKGTPMTIDAIVDDVARRGVGLVEVTGGEPLLQPGALTLMHRLCEAGHEVLLETSGSLDIGPVDARVRRIVDFKTPSSGEVGSNRLENITALRPGDEVKLVMGDRADYEWGRALVREHCLEERCTVLFGPVFGALAPETLAGWLLDDRLPVRMQLQLHKFIWDPRARGV